MIEVNSTMAEAMETRHPERRLPSVPDRVTSTLHDPPRVIRRMLMSARWYDVFMPIRRTDRIPKCRQFLPPNETKNNDKNSLFPVL